MVGSGCSVRQKSAGTLHIYTMWYPGEAECGMGTMRKIVQEQIGTILLQKILLRSIKMIKGLRELIFEKRLRKINAQFDTQPGRNMITDSSNEVYKMLPRRHSLGVPCGLQGYSLLQEVVRSGTTGGMDHSSF